MFHALGLKVGVHPIIENKSENMGGLSAKELLLGPTIPREGDFVENCLQNLAERSSARHSDEYEDTTYDENGEYYYIPEHQRASYGRKEEQDDYSTIVGTKLHSPKLDPCYEEEDQEVSPNPETLFSHPIFVIVIKLY